MAILELSLQRFRLGFSSLVVLVSGGLISGGGVSACDAFAPPFEPDPDGVPRFEPVGSGGSSHAVSSCVDYEGEGTSYGTYHQVLYSWLSEGDLERLEEEGEVLTPRDDQMSTIIDQWRQETSDLVVDDRSTVLRRLTFAVPAVRPSWPYPFATAIGPFGTTSIDSEGKPSGDGTVRPHLLRVVLRDSALLLVAEGTHLSVVQSNGLTVSDDTLLRESGRLAAILSTHEPQNRDALDYPVGGSARGPRDLCALGRGDQIGPRSYLLVNPDQILEWSIGSVEAEERFQKDLADLWTYLEALRREGDPTYDPWDWACQWFASVPDPCVGEYALSLSTTSDATVGPYAPTKRGVVTLIDFLNALPEETNVLSASYPEPSWGGAGGADR